MDIFQICKKKLRIPEDNQELLDILLYNIETAKALADAHLPNLIGTTEKPLLYDVLVINTAIDFTLNEGIYSFNAEAKEIPNRFTDIINILKQHLTY